MNKLIIPISDLKSYARIVKKHSQNSRIKRTDILNCITRTLGFDSYSSYEIYLNKKMNLGYREHFTLESSDTCPLNVLINWSNLISDDLMSILDLNSLTIDVLGREVLSTPLDKYILHQVNNIDKLPALRVSGILYLLSLCSGREFFDANTWSISWSSFLEYLKNDTLPYALNQRFEKFRVLNEERGLRYHEGLFDIIETDLIVGTINNDEAIKAIDALLAEEREYIANVSFGKSIENVVFSFPLYYEEHVSGEFSENLAIIREHTSVQKPLLLGLEHQPSIMGSLGWPSKKKTLTLTTEDMRQNIMITGVAGSGREFNNLFLLRQAVMNDYGAVYIDGGGSPGTFWHLKSILKSHNRENDLTILTLNHQSDLRALDLTSLAIQKKIVYVMLPSLEKDPELLGEYVCDLIRCLGNSLPDKGGALKSGYFPFCLFLNQTMRSLQSKLRKDILCSFIDKANKNKLAIVASEQDYAFSRAPMDYDYIVSRFKTHIVMKLECTNDFIFDLPPKISREIISLDVGSFRYFRYGGYQDATTYKVPYLMSPNSKYCYLVMS